MEKITKSLTRTQAREIENKLNPAIRALSVHLHNTGEVTTDFRGYKVPAGILKDKRNRTWQLQIQAVCVKKDFIKKDKVVPLIRKWAIGLKLRVLAKYLINWSNKN